MERQFLAATYPGHSAESRLKHIPSISMKEAYLLVLEFQAEEHAFGLAHM